MLVFVIAGVMWFNVLFVGFRLWVASEVQADLRRTARDLRGGRPGSPR